MRAGLLRPAVPNVSNRISRIASKIIITAGFLGSRVCKEKTPTVSRSDQEWVTWGALLIHTLLVRRSRASSSTCEALERRSFQTGLELLELEERWHVNNTARSTAFSPDSCDDGAERQQCEMRWENVSNEQFHESAALGRLQIRDVSVSHRGTSKFLNRKVTETSVQPSAVQVELQHRAVVSK